MPRFRSALLLPILAVLLGFLSLHAFAQEDGVIRSQVRQIFVPVTVYGQEDKPLGDIRRDEFHILEDGMEQELLNVAREEVPLNVVFLMDISHSEFLELGAIKKAIRGFASGLRSEDRISLITFNSESRLILDWSNDLVRLDKALNRVVPKGNTVWYDALYVTLHDQLRHVKGKKVVIAVTDGMDTGSLMSYKDIMDQAKSSDVQFYLVSKASGLKDYAEYLRKEYNMQYDETRLSKIMYECEAQLHNLAYETGGKVLNIKSGKLDEIYRGILEELRLQYYLSYTPHNIVKDGQYRHIEVRVDRPGLRIHNRPGYYAK